MVYFVIDIVYVLFVFIIYKLRISKNQLIRSLDNGYSFYQSLSLLDRDIYWKKDTYLVLLFMILIGISMNILFIQLNMNIYVFKAIVIFVMNLMISIMIYSILYLKLKKEFQ